MTIKSMIEFSKTISQSEINSKYLNLKDDFNRKYGSYFPTHATKLIILDNQERKFDALKHHEHQIWGSLRRWFETNNITAGTKIIIKYDSNEKLDGKPVIRLIIERIGELPKDKIIEKEWSEIYESEKIEIPIEFEKQLESFLEKNLGRLENGLKLYKDESGQYGRQYPIEEGIIDLLCVDKEGNFVIIELKKGRGSREAVGQIQHYMGWVKENLCKEKQEVLGIIITHEFDTKLKYSVSANDKLRIRYYKIHLEFVSEKEVKAPEKTSGKF